MTAGISSRTSTIDRKYLTGNLICVDQTLVNLVLGDGVVNALAREFVGGIDSRYHLVKGGENETLGRTAAEGVRLNRCRQTIAIVTVGYLVLDPVSIQDWATPGRKDMVSHPLTRDGGALVQVD